MNQSVGTQSIPPTDFMSVLHPRLFLDDPDAINVNDSDVERLKGFIFNDNDKESGNIDSEREELGLETLLDNVQQSLETSSIETFSQFPQVSSLRHSPESISFFRPYFTMQTVRLVHTFKRCGCLRMRPDCKITGTTSSLPTVPEPDPVGKSTFSSLLAIVGRLRLS
jgi:hypothetical protein